MTSTDQLPARSCDRGDAARLVLGSLMAAKRWFREATRASYPELSPAALMTLALVEAHGPARVGELADRARVDASVVSRQLHQLEEAGQVRRAADPLDGRAHLVSLTSEGRAVLQEGRTRLEAVAVERLARWDADELVDIAERLHRLMDDLTEHPRN